MTTAINTNAIATAIPNTGALTQAQYDEAKKNGDDYIETLRIKGRFINDQLVSAQIAGADKAAEALQKQLDAFQVTPGVLVMPVESSCLQSRSSVSSWPTHLGSESELQSQ